MLKKVLLSTLLCTTLGTTVIDKANAEEVKNEQPVKYVFKSGGKYSPVYTNRDGSLTVPEELEQEVYVYPPAEFFIFKNGKITDELLPKYQYILDQERYYRWYTSKGKTADLFVGEHPRPVNGEVFVPKYSAVSDNTNSNDQQNDTNGNQPEPTKVDQPSEAPKKDDATPKAEAPKKDDVTSKAETPKKDDATPKAEAPKKDDANAKAEAPKKDDVTPKAEAPKKDDAKTKAEAPKKDDAKAKAEAPKKDDVKAKAEAPKKDDAKTKAETPKKDDVKVKTEAPKKDDVKVKAEAPKKDEVKSEASKKEDSKNEKVNKDNKAADKKSDNQQKELPKTGENDNTLLRNVLLTVIGLSLIGVYRLLRKAKV